MNHALKGDQSLIDLIMKLKVNYLKIQEYLYVSLYDSLINTSHIYLAAFTLFTLIGRLLDT
jgi:hypothetical protein